MENTRPRLPVEVVERIIDAVALLPTSDAADLTPRQIYSRYKTLWSCTLLCTQLHPRSKLHLYHTIILTRNDGVKRLTQIIPILITRPHLAHLVKTVIITDKDARHGEGYRKPKRARHDATRRAMDEASGLFGTQWPGFEDIFQRSQGFYAGPESGLLDAFLGRVVPRLPALRTLRTHVIPMSFDPDTPDAIWRRNLDSLHTHTIVVLELASVTFRSSRDFIVMLKALRLLRILRCTQVAWGVHEWQPEWQSLPHSLGLVELELNMSDWLLDLPALERNAWAGGIVTALHASMFSLEKLRLDEGALQLLCGSLAQATKSPPDDNFAMTALHTIHLDLDRHYHAVSNIPFLFNGRLGPTRHLRTLVIDFDPNAVSSVKQAAAALPSFSTRLEDILCGPAYGALERVDFPLPGRASRRGRGAAEAERAAWQQLVRDHFPMLRERGATVLRC